MKLIVGLGNPGEKYKNTRHNAGFRAVEAIAEKIGCQWEKNSKFDSLIINHQSSIILLKPLTFMNNSGKAVVKTVNHYKILSSDIWVIHDDLDMTLGEYKIQQAKGPKLHYGVQSIENSLGKSEFWRIRIGVDNRDPQGRLPGEAYVLQKFNKQELVILNNVIDKIIRQLSID